MDDFELLRLHAALARARLKSANISPWWLAAAVPAAGALAYGAYRGLRPAEPPPAKPAPASAAVGPPAPFDPAAFAKSPAPAREQPPSLRPHTTRERLRRLFVDRLGGAASAAARAFHERFVDRGALP